MTTMQEQFAAMVEVDCCGSVDDPIISDLTCTPQPPPPMTATGTNRQFHVKAVINKPTNSTVGTVVAYAKLNGATTDLRQMSDMGGFHQTNMKFNVNVPNGSTLTIEVKATIQKICEPTSAAVTVTCP